ncbi:MAG TPA: hypothetical protein DHT43_09515, partial [Deltaproteobacteria bacterium]|nr:hypothetical protein [Deltaproteobacteria bacterium]
GVRKSLSGNWSLTTVNCYVSQGSFSPINYRPRRGKQNPNPKKACIIYKKNREYRAQASQGKN